MAMVWSEKDMAMVPYSGPQRQYRYRLGVHGEHCIDCYELKWTMAKFVGRAATKADADEIVAAFNETVGIHNTKGGPA